jgi:CRP/FNR family transcriptional regulator, cyclic AMP receptor protein
MAFDFSTPRLRPLAQQPALAARAAEFLVSPATGIGLSPQEMAAIVARMTLVAMPAGAALLREGEDPAQRYLLLLLEGEVEVDSRAGPSINPLALAVLGPGSVIGEMSLMDHAPRSATCVAMSPVLAASLTREALDHLIEHEPRAAAKLLMGLAQRMADRLRALGQMVHLYADLAARG